MKGEFIIKYLWKSVVGVGLIGICFIVICLVFGLFEGDEKESLLDFTCEELREGHISQDGRNNRLVTDEVSGRWVDDRLIKQALLAKGCIVEKDSLLDFTCAELAEGNITLDKHTDKFVVGGTPVNVKVSKQYLREAIITKRCIKEGIDIFNYVLID